MRFLLQHTRLLVTALMLSAESSPAQTAFGPSDRAEVAALIAGMAATARRAWETRNAFLLVPDTVLVIRRPDGGTMTAAQLRADLQRRMDMTTRVDTLVEHLDSVRVVGPDSILAYSSQRFVRVIRLADGSQRQRVSTIIHERPAVRRGGHWRLVGAVREIAPQAWWADEGPPPKLVRLPVYTYRETS